MAEAFATAALRRFAMLVTHMVKDGSRSNKRLFFEDVCYLRVELTVSSLFPPDVGRT